MMISCGYLLFSFVSRVSASLTVSVATTSFLGSSSSSSSFIGLRLPPGLASSFFSSKKLLEIKARLTVDVLDFQK
jgi:hypothetical protein